SPPDELIFFETNLLSSALHNGRNALAVEVHQSSGSSSDIGFDLELTGETVTLPQPLPLRVARSGTNQVLVSWPQPAVGFALQAASKLAASNSWSNVAAVVSIQGTNDAVAVPARSNNLF